MRRIRFLQPLLAAAALAAPLLAAADPRYTVTAIAGAGSFARDIDKQRQVVGNAEAADGDGHAFLCVDALPGNPGDLYPGLVFLYENGEAIDLNTRIEPAAGGTVTGAGAIDDRQQSAAPEPPMAGLLAAGLALGLARGGGGRGGLRPPVRRRRG